MLASYRSFYAIGDINTPDLATISEVGLRNQIAGYANPRPVLSLHNGQLPPDLIISASERTPLKERSAKAQYTRSSDDPGSTAKAASMFSKRSFTFGLGLAVIVVRWLLVTLALKLCNKAHALRWYIAPAAGLVGAFLMIHGLFLAATGTGLLAILNRRPENIGVKAIIIPELELRNVKMQPVPYDAPSSYDDISIKLPSGSRQ
jgi:hypothetical protein